MLELRNLVVNYGVITALQGVSLSVKQGAIVTLIGANGAGKTTTLKTISGLLKGRSGEIVYQGRNIARLPPHQIVKLGISHVPEGRMIFANLTVMENLMMGAYLQRNKALVQRELDYICGIFPRLMERQKQIAGTLSGGEQQMLAIGRALMGNPRVLLMDEPSEGLAPQIVAEVMATIRKLKESGLSIVLVEQNPKLVFDVADDIVILNTGRVAVVSTPSQLEKDGVDLRQHLGVF